MAPHKFRRSNKILTSVSPSFRPPSFLFFIIFFCYSYITFIFCLSSIFSGKNIEFPSPSLAASLLKLYLRELPEALLAEMRCWFLELAGEGIYSFISFTIISIFFFFSSSICIQSFPLLFWIFLLSSLCFYFSNAILQTERLNPANSIHLCMILYCEVLVSFGFFLFVFFDVKYLQTGDIKPATTTKRDSERVDAVLQ